MACWPSFAVTTRCPALAGQASIAFRVPSVTDPQGPPGSQQIEASVPVGGGQLDPVPSSAQLVANAALSLLNLCCYLLNRQLKAQAEAFEKEGGITERLYKRRSQKRRGLK